MACGDNQSRKRERLVYLATRFPYPPASGREAMIFQSVEMLRDEFDIHFVYFAAADAGEDRISALQSARVSRLKFPGLLRILYNIARFPHKSLQECLFYSSAAQARIDRILEQDQPDIVIADMIRTAQFVEGRTAIKRVCEMDDRLSIRYARKIALLRDGGNLLGTFENILPGAVASWLSRIAGKTILKVERRRIAHREAQICRGFDAVTLVSPLEAAELSQQQPSARVCAIPPAVKPRALSDFDRAPVPRLLFIGNMKYSQNRSSVEYIVDEVLPLLDAAGLHYRFSIIGDYDDRARQLSGRNNSLEFLGYVASIDDVVRQSSLLLAPVSTGTGIKTKILDAMVLGLPVVTNSIGAEGIGANNYQNIVVEDTAHGIAGAVLSLVRDPSMARRIGEGGWRFVQSRFSFGKIQADYLQLLRDIHWPPCP